jgi:hypothetical protein
VWNAEVSEMCRAIVAPAGYDLFVTPRPNRKVRELHIHTSRAATSLRDTVGCSTPRCGALQCPWCSAWVRIGFPAAPAERSSRASPLRRPREDELTHPADTSRSNLVPPWVCFRGGFSNQARGQSGPLCAAPSLARGNSSSPELVGCAAVQADGLAVLIKTGTYRAVEMQPIVFNDCADRVAQLVHVGLSPSHHP